MFLSRFVSWLAFKTKTLPSAICAEAYEESSKCPEGCVFESTMEYTDYAWIRTLAIVGAVLYVPVGGYICFRMFRFLSRMDGGTSLRRAG